MKIPTVVGTKEPGTKKSYYYAKGFLAQAGSPAEALCVGGLVNFLFPDSCRDKTI